MAILAVAIASGASALAIFIFALAIANSALAIKCFAQVAYLVLNQFPSASELILTDRASNATLPNATDACREGYRVAEVAYSHACCRQPSLNPHVPACSPLSRRRRIGQ